MHLFTIGFTRKSAEQFFETLRAAGVRRLIDVRLNKSSQLSGFAKGRDLEYFLKRVAGIDYVDVPELAPGSGMLAEYRRPDGNWEHYQVQYRNLIASRRVEQVLKADLFENACLLCSEHEPDCCHRRIAAEYLRTHWGGVDIVHLR